MIAATLLAASLAAVPLECPPGTTPAGGTPPEADEAWCEKPGLDGRARREGPARTWYDDGTAWVEESYRDGERDGPSVEYHRNGRPAREGAWSRGLRIGTWTIRAPSGAVEETSTWREGVKDGPYTAHHANGAKRIEGRHCGGAQCGVWRTFDESGREIGRVEYGEQRFRP